MTTITFWFESLLYCLCIYSILKNIYGYTTKSNKLIYLLPIIYIPLISLNILFNQFILNYIFLTVILVNILFLKFVFLNAKLRSILCIFIILYSINIVVSSITVFVFNSSKSIMLKEFTGLAINSILMITCMVISNIKKLYLKTQFSMIPTSVKRITMFSLMSSAFVISLISDYSAVKDIGKWEFSIRITLVILIIIVGSAFPIMIANSIGKSFYTEQSKNFEHQIQTQAAYYENLSKSNYELRRFRHDYKNMRIGVTKYIHDGNIEEAENMLNNCDSLLKQTTQSLIKFDTGNGIVDAILTEKQEKATTVNTVITFNGTIAASAITATDLCVIFGNTLDNAIEACEKLQTDIKKKISVVCKCNSGFMFLTISNPVAENIKIHNNTIQTTKQDKSTHGFGLYSLQKIVDKYDGTLALSCVDQIFKCDVTLNL